MFRKYVVFIFGLSFILGFSQKKDNRTFQQINDSILLEAQLLYKFDKAFVSAMQAVNLDRKLNNKAGEILIMPKKDTIFAIIMDKEKPDFMLGKIRFEYSEDSAYIDEEYRMLNAEEKAFHTIKHKIMNDVQAQYEIDTSGDYTYLNPVLIPFKDEINGKLVDLYKFYLITETNEANTIPFGQDYLFYADNTGKVFYYLQFNPYMPLSISEDMLDRGTVTIEYPKREPYITPTDIFLFTKYGTEKGLNYFRVKSTVYDIFFNYNWDRDTLDATLD